MGESAKGKVAREAKLILNQKATIELAADQPVEIGVRAAGAFFRQRAVEHIPQEDRARFAEVAETEIISIHEGNIARYRLRPSEYQAWRESVALMTAVRLP